MSTVTKRELIQRVTDRLGSTSDHGLTERQVQAVLYCLIEQMTESLAEGRNVALRDFGTFLLSARKPKIGRNPKEPDHVVPIPARASVRFRPSREVREKVAAALPYLDEKE
jgi:nucleoid DNA-binding protein